MVILILASFISIFLSLGSAARTGKREALQQSSLIFCVVLVFLTELAGLFETISFIGLSIAWLLVLLACLVYLMRHKAEVIPFSRSLVSEAWQIIISRTRNKWHLGFILLVLLMVFVQGLVYPPNNYDAMTYHMARIPEWISHASLAPYPTSIYRQIYQPPFSSYFILNLNLLSGNDYLSNSVQLFFLLLTVNATTLVMDALGISRNLYIYAVLLVVTVPSIILQASGATNNIIDGYFIMAATYYALKIARNNELKYFAGLGLAFGLGMLTKGTAYIYIGAISAILIIVVSYRLIRVRDFTLISKSLVAVLLALLVNLAFYQRNYALTGHLLGLDKAESAKYRNTHFSAGLLFSNVIKNAALHMGPYPVSKMSGKLVRKVHAVTGIDINETSANFDKIPFSIPRSPNFEDTAPNPLHFLMILLATIVVLGSSFRRWAWRKRILLYLGFIMLQALFFCAWLKWQPWHTRNHVPLFMLSVPLICYVAYTRRWFFKTLRITSVLMMAYGLAIVLLNRTRPFIPVSAYTSGIELTDTREKKYFSNNPDLYEEYRKVINALKECGASRVGLYINWNDYEYPLFPDIYRQMVYPVHLFVQENPTEYLQNYAGRIDCIVSAKTYLPYIDYNGRRYNKQDSNRNISFYR